MNKSLSERVKKIEKLQREEETKFYSKAIEYHEDTKLKKLFGRMDMSVPIDSIDNENMDSDQEKHPGYHPVESFDLLYGEDGFVIAAHWHGDFFPHTNYQEVYVRGKKLRYDHQGHKGWPILDMFPDLKIEDIETKIDTALKYLEVDAKKK